MTLSFIPDHGARHISWPCPLLLTRAREDDPVPVNCSEQGILDYLHLFMCHRPGQALTNIILQKHWQHQQKNITMKFDINRKLLSADKHKSFDSTAALRFDNKDVLKSALWQTKIGK